MAVHIAKKGQKPEIKQAKPFDLEGNFMRVFRPHVPKELQEFAFQKEAGKFRHAWTEICFNIYKDSMEKVLKLDELLTQSEQDLVKCTDLLEAFGGTDKAKAIRENLTQIKALHKAYAPGVKQNVANS